MAGVTHSADGVALSGSGVRPSEATVWAVLPPSTVACCPPSPESLPPAPASTHSGPPGFKDIATSTNLIDLERARIHVKPDGQLRTSDELLCQPSGFRGGISQSPHRVNVIRFHAEFRHARTERPMGLKPCVQQSHRLLRRTHCRGLRVVPRTSGGPQAPHVRLGAGKQ
jgi:hypothetical protein